MFFPPISPNSWMSVMLLSDDPKWLIDFRENCHEHRLRCCCFFSFSSLPTAFCVLLLPSHRNNQGRFYCGVKKKKKKSCLLTLPSAENKKREDGVFCCVSFVWQSLFFCCCCSLAVTYLKRFKDIMGCDLQIGPSPSAPPSLLGLGRPRTTGPLSSRLSTC